MKIRGAGAARQRRRGARLDANVVGVLLNLTAVKPTAERRSCRSCPTAPGRSAPATSNLNALAGSVKANLVIVPVGADGAHAPVQHGRQHQRRWSTSWATCMTGDAETTRTGRVIPLTAPFRAFDTREAAFGAVPLGPGAGRGLELRGVRHQREHRRRGGGQPVGAARQPHQRRPRPPVPHRARSSPATSRCTPARHAGAPPLISNLNTVESEAGAEHGAGHVRRQPDGAGVQRRGLRALHPRRQAVVSPTDLVGSPGSDRF